jgi:hypothetical protein
MMELPESELRDGMRVDWNVAIITDGGLALRADALVPPER